MKNEEVEAIQGSPIKETKTSQTPSGSNLQTVQCFYVATEFSKSVSLSLTRAAPQSSTKTVVTEFWKERFANPQKRDEQEREADREKKESLREQHREQEEKEGSALQKIEGIGDDAYWSGTRVGGALYVLKNQAFLRISLGGADSNEARIEKTRELAAKALQRL